MWLFFIKFFTFFSSIYAMQEALRLYYNESRRLFVDKFLSGFYFKELSPVFTMTQMNDTDPVPRFTLKIILAYLRIVNLDPQAQEISCMVDFKYEWVDARLQWNPDKYSGLETLWLNADQVWFPENVLTDVQSLTNMTPENQRQVRLWSNVTIVYYFSTSVRAACQMDIRLFPFDTQTCSFGFSPLTYDFELVTSSSQFSEDFYLSSETGNGEWIVHNLSLVAEVYTGPTFDYEWVGFSVRMRRQPEYYIFVIILPCFVLTMLSIVGMFWNAPIKEEKLTKLSIGLTSMMSMTLLLDMMSKEIPKTAAFPLLGFYVIISIAIIALGCAVVVIVSSPADQERKKPLKEKLRAYLYSRTFALQLIFQLLNTVNFFVLLGVWLL